MENVVFPPPPGVQKQIRLDTVLGDSSFNCQIYHFDYFKCLLFKTQGALPRLTRPFPCNLPTLRKVKSKQVKSTQTKGKVDKNFFLSFSFFQYLKTLVSKVSISHKKNRQFQLLNPGKEPPSLFLEREKAHPHNTQLSATFLPAAFQMIPLR